VTAPGGRSYVALVILCERCDRAGRHRRLALFGSHTYPGADRTPWIRGFAMAGAKVRSLWWGPDGTDKVKLACDGTDSGRGCQNMPDIRREWVTAQLEEIWAPGSRETREFLR
jgi:hypothetical protein